MMAISRATPSNDFPTNSNGVPICSMGLPILVDGKGTATLVAPGTLTDCTTTPRLMPHMGFFCGRFPSFG